MWKYILAWVPMVGIAILNGVMRETFFAGHMDALSAHQLSTLSAVILFGLYILGLVRLFPPASARQALQVGLIWLGMTIAFEFLFGHFVMGHPWHRLFYDYNIFAGRTWILFLIWITIAPRVFFRSAEQQPESPGTDTGAK